MRESSTDSALLMNDYAVSSPKVLVIVLTWNGIADTRACLVSLRRVTGVPFDVLVVDNGSTDATVTVVRTEFPDVLLLENGGNLGFAEGNNRGLDYALARGYAYALLLNNDTEVAPDYLEHLVRRCEEDPMLGAVGPIIYYFDAPETIWSAGGIVDRKSGRTFMRGLDEKDDGQYAEAADVDFVTGCALLARCAILADTGLIDERFGMYFEETEWCARIRRKGWKIAVEPRSHVWHKIQPQRQSLSPRVTYYMTRNRLLYLRLTRAPLAAWIHAALLQDWRTWLSWGVRSRWRDRGQVRKEIPRAWRDFLQGRFGMVSRSFGE